MAINLLSMMASIVRNAGYQVIYINYKTLTFKCIYINKMNIGISVVIFAESLLCSEQK